MLYYVFWCGKCQQNTPHAQWRNADQWWDWRCIVCNQRQIISL